jgi:triosephosphate isomerase (TIM)
MLIAGNWKMNPPTMAEAYGLARVVAEAHEPLEGVDAVVCPPAIWLTTVAQAVTGTRLQVGAQTMHAEERGAFTGETSPLMLRGFASHVILGHSERRQYDNETDEGVARKVASAVAHGLRPIAAIGERIDERRAGATEAVIDRQLRAAVSGLDTLLGSGLVVAYEPVWAIGTGEAAAPADAQAVASQIRAILRERFGADADGVPIQYGGSVTADNAADFFAQPDVDGALVGGASLKVDQFAAILAAADAAAG